MNTPLGKIEIYVNEEPVTYRTIELSPYGKHFRVDKRFRLICDIPFFDTPIRQVKCAISFADDITVFSGSETGENLALISFEWNNNKLSIGTLGDIPGVTYHYHINALSIDTLPNTQQVTFYISWLKINDYEKESIYTWFASDPAFDVE